MKCTVRTCQRVPEAPFKMCERCRRKARERRRIPKAKATRKAYDNRPENKAKRSVYRKAYHAKNKERVNAERKAREAERLAAGLCAYCGKYPLDRPDRKMCMDCREDKADYNAKPLNKKRRSAYYKKYTQQPYVKEARRISAKKFYGSDKYYEMLARAAAKESEK